jgi:hypothetical protein
MPFTPTLYSSPQEEGGLLRLILFFQFNINH